MMREMALPLDSWLVWLVVAGIGLVVFLWRFLRDE